MARGYLLFVVRIGEDVPGPGEPFVGVGVPMIASEGHDHTTMAEDYARIAKGRRLVGAPDCAIKTRNSVFITPMKRHGDRGEVSARPARQPMPPK